MMVKPNVWTDLYERDIERLTDERDEARAEVERLREALIQMDEAICHGNPATAKRIAREAYANGQESGKGNA